MRSDPDFPGEDPGEMKEAHVGLFRQLFQRQVGLEAFVDVGDGVGHGCAVSLAFAVLGGQKQEIIQKLRDVGGQLAFKDRGRVPEYFVDLFQLIDRGLRVFRYKYIAVDGHDLMIVISRQFPVKMHPQSVPGPGASIAVAFVAVQEDKLPCFGGERPVRQGDAADAPGDVHDQETVEPVPPDPVVRVIIKKPDGGGIKVEPDSQFAGGIDIIIRQRQHFFFLGTHSGYPSFACDGFIIEKEDQIVNLFKPESKKS